MAEPTEQFGPYKVYERLGLGGMATVHRAKKQGIEGFEQLVALKRLLPHLAEDTEFVNSFVREAKLASMLHHANIVNIYELGRVQGQYFIAMEYLPGRDLRKLLMAAHGRRCPPPIGVTIAILRSLCEALEHAHQLVEEGSGNVLGLIHRDVSPSNLIVSDAGYLKVIDFGIAKATQMRGQTNTGRFVGKLGYSSPEATQGKPLDRRADIFSTGVVAHELLTVRPLFTAKTDYETVVAVVNGEIEPPSLRNPECPPEFDAAVLRALARNVDDRWPSAAALRDELDRIAVSHHLDSTPGHVARWLESLAIQTDAEVAAPPEPIDDDRSDVIELVWGNAQGGQSVLHGVELVEQIVVATPEATTVSALTPQAGDGDGDASSDDGADDGDHGASAEPEGLRITTRCGTADEFMLLFSHLYEDDSLLLFTPDVREVGTHARFSLHLRDGEKVLSGHGEVREIFSAEHSPFAKPAMRVIFDAIDADTLPVWKRLRRAASHTVQMWSLSSLYGNDLAPTAVGTEPLSTANLAVTTAAGGTPEKSRATTGPMWAIARLQKTQQMAVLPLPPAPSRKASGEGAPDLLQEMERWIAEAEQARALDGGKTHKIPALERSGELLLAAQLSAPVEELVNVDLAVFDLTDVESFDAPPPAPKRNRPPPTPIVPRGKDRHARTRPSLPARPPRDVAAGTPPPERIVARSPPLPPPPNAAPTDKLPEVARAAPVAVPAAADTAVAAPGKPAARRPPPGKPAAVAQRTDLIRQIAHHASMYPTLVSVVAVVVFVAALCYAILR